MSSTVHYASGQKKHRFLNFTGYKFTVILFLMIAVVSAIQIWFLMYYRSTLTQNALSNLETESRQRSYALTRYLDDINTSAISLNRALAVSDYLRGTELISHEITETNVNDSLDNLLGLNSSLKGVYMTDLDRNVLLSSKRSDLDDNVADPLLNAGLSAELSSDQYFDAPTKIFPTG